MANLDKRTSTKDKFYPLDNSAVFLASVTSKAAPFVYRLSCELKETIWLPDLERAFAGVIDRFPAFRTELRPGFFWYYLDPLKKPIKLMADSRFPVEYHPLGKWGCYLFRVRVYASRISCEFHHSLTDGTGALEFLKSLTAEYLALRGIECSNWNGVIRAHTPVDPAEYEDAYALRGKKNIPLPDPLPRAYHLEGKRYKGNEYRVTTGTASAAQALQVARSKGVTLTELLASIHLFALQTVAEESPHKKKPLCVQVPVNMRKMYPSKTLRNFFLFIPLSLDLRLGHYELEEILERVHCIMKLNLNTKEMDRQMRRNVGSEEQFFARIVPLAIKNKVLGLVGKLAADTLYSGSLSNLGLVNLPPECSGSIQRFDFLPARNSATGAHVGVVTWQDTLSITIGSLVVDRAFECAFFRTCVKAGLPVRVESNLQSAVNEYT